jgi:arylsulfatase A-like enzyme
LDGVSLWPHIERGTPLPARTLYWGHAAQRAVRRGSWKLVRFPKEEPFLSDLQADPGERTNLAAKRPEEVRIMLDALAAWEKDVQPGV